ncbi:MAG: ATP-binding protein [Desulfobulbaceae bacterium BRH_c16a]|nr:MAG: ATP-binding protein [Desulfobulbaceae bacterium BRH_c16a]
MTVTISIGSGKGGTGKTMVIVNLALLLAKTGKKVCLVDLDLGGADAHILFGLFEPKRTLTDFLTRKVESIDDVIHTFYSFQGLQFIPGTGNTLQTANLSYQEKQRLLRALSSIEADVLLIDVGAGTNYHALDFFMFSDLQICVTLPDPTSIMDLYTFLQLATIRKVLGSFLSQSDVGIFLKNHNFTTLNEVFELAEKTREGTKAKAQLALKYFHPLLIVNRDGADSKVNKFKMRKMVAKYLSIDIPELGDIPEDPKIDESLKTYMPVCELYPKSPAALSLKAIAGKVDKIIGLFARNDTPN